MPYKDLEMRKQHSREYNKRHYKKHHRKIKARLKRNQKRRFLEMEPLINELKSKPCADCHHRFPPVAMDFDHVRGRKVRSISNMIRDGYSVETIMKELEKCDLVCACCHRVRTDKRRRKK